MNKNKILALLISICIMASCSLFCGFCFLKKKCNDTKQETKVNNSIIKNEETDKDLWCITFQLVWNEFSDYIKQDKVKLLPSNPPLADELNKKLYTKADISEDSYFLAQGKTNKDLKKQIENGIYKKFKEKSDIINLINWEDKEGYLFYAMLKKNFTFPKAFDILSPSTFEGKGNYKYFGKKGKNNFDENLKVLFYKNENEYAVSLNTKENEKVILFRTEKDDNFENLYKYIKENISLEEFSKLDTLKIPYLKVDKTLSFGELCNKKIAGTNLMISQALQTIKFNLDNKGGSLKSEAAIALMKCAMPMAPEKPRHYDFDKKFVLFLIETGKDNPYFAMKVNDDSFLIKE